MSLRYLMAGPLLFLHRLLNRRDGLRVLLFHDIPHSQLPAFEALVTTLAGASRLVTPTEAEAVLAGTGTARRGACLLSFDDGFAGNFTIARTILARHGAKGLFFVCPGLMDLPADQQRAAIAANIFDGRRNVADLPPDARLMDWDEVAALAADGHAIGSHTLSHRRMTLLNKDEVAEEVVGAATRLTTRLGQPIQWFAFPFGDIASVDQAVLSEISAHHSYCRSGIRGANDGTTPAMAVRADQVELSAPASWQWLAVEGGLDRRYVQPRRMLDKYARAL